MEANEKENHKEDRGKKTNANCNQTTAEGVSSPCGRPKGRQRRSDYRAKHWTYLFDTLRRTVDAIYETCRADRSTLECKEAIMILKNYTHDFDSLIECLNVELAWESADKPKPVAWEVRKTSMGSPNKAFTPAILESGTTDASEPVTIKLVPPGSVVGLLSPVKSLYEPKPIVTDCSTQTKGLTPEAKMPPNDTPRTSTDDSDDGWNVVRRGRRSHKKAALAAARQHQFPEYYDDRRQSSRIIFPKSAMDIPQTKASMAKMAYSRRLLWEKKQDELKEKLFKQQRAQQHPRKSGSLPSLQRIGINFADPNAVRRSAEALRNSLQQARKTKYRSYASADSVQSLESITEEPPSDPVQKELVIDIGDDDLRHLTEEEESLAQEEESLQKEIEEEERKSIDAELERQVAIEAEEVELQIESPDVDEDPQAQPPDKKMRWQDIVARWQIEGSFMATVSWDQLVEMELSEVRAPGEAVQMHEKLSSPSRKRNPQDTVRRHEERLAKAEEMRQSLLEQKANRLRELSSRVEEVREKRQKITECKRVLLADRLAKAEVNRKHQLQAVVKKAKDEEDKVHEIAFINNLEADNRRFDARARQHDHQQRMQSIQEERQRKVEATAAREAAADERRRAADEERASRLRELAEKKRKRQEQIEIQKVEHEKERISAAKEKAREREERIADLKAAQQARSDQVLHRIQQKQQESSRRHVETLELVKMRAIELSSPRIPLTPGHESKKSMVDWNRPPSAKKYAPAKICTLCNVRIESDMCLLSHLHSEDHSAKQLASEASDEQLLTDETQTPQTQNNDKNKTCKKRKQKLRQRIVSKTREYESSRSKMDENETNFNRPKKLMADLENLLDANQKMLPETAVHNIERILGEIGRKLISKESHDAFWTGIGVDVLLKLIAFCDRDGCGLPVRSVLKACSLLKSLLNCPNIALDFLYSSKILSLLDLTASQLRKLRAEAPKHDALSLTAELLGLVEKCWSTVENVLQDQSFWSRFDGGLEGFRARCAMLASYLVLSGSFESMCCVIGSLADAVLEASYEPLILSWARMLCHWLQCLRNPECVTTWDDSFGAELGGTLTLALRDSNLSHLLHLTYGSLFHDVASMDRVSPFDASPTALSLAQSTLQLFNTLATVHHSDAQDLMSDDCSGLEFGFVASFLLGYCSRHEQYTELLHQCIMAVGHISVLSTAGQNLVEIGSEPTILQQLCVLPFNYFSQPALMDILFPTLLACCFGNQTNTNILREELNCTFVADFIESKLESDKSDSRSLTRLESRFPRKSWTEAKEYFRKV